jgi:Niemann-Pick C1 protein
VGPGSRAARDKAAFEASFGPFYRVAQLIISTTPDSASNYTASSGLPAIVSDANIRLLFDMQYMVDSLTGVMMGRSVGACS